MEFSKFSSASIASLEALLSAPTPVEPTQKFLRFRLDRAQALLIPVSDVVEVKTVSIAEILPVPQMADCVIGIYNWRGEALWLVDLAQQLGFDALPKTVQRIATVMLIVVRQGTQAIGLMVPEVSEIEQYNPDKLLVPSAEVFPEKLLPFVKGYFLQDFKDELQRNYSIVLNVSAVLNDPCLRSHC